MPNWCEDKLIVVGEEDLLEFGEQAKNKDKHVVADKTYEKGTLGWIREQAKNKEKRVVADKTCEKGTLGWIREQAKRDGFDNIRYWQNWKGHQNIKNIDQVEKIVKENKIDIKDETIFYNFWRKIDIKDNIGECWPWTEFVHARGYGYFSLSGEKVGAHRLSYMLTKGRPIPEELQVQHICNNRLCCNPYHLELGDNSKNMIYMYRCNRRNCSGGNNGGAILTEYQVREIHKIHIGHPVLKQWQIAEMFKISQVQISDIINGKSWHKIYEEIHNEHFDDIDNMEQLKPLHEEETKQSHEQALRDLGDMRF